MIMKRYIIILFILGFCSLILTAFQNCGTETGKPSNNEIDVVIAPYDQQAKVMQLLLPNAHATVNSVSICVHMLHLKKNGGSSSGQNVHFSPGLVTLNSSGTNLGSVKAPKGEYRRVDLMLKDDCGTGYSLRVENEEGDFMHESASPLNLKFEGDIIIDSDTSELVLDAQAIISALNDANSNAAVEAAADDNSGDLDTN